MLMNNLSASVGAAHGALVIAAVIYAGFNVVMARCLNSGVSPIAFSLVRETFAIVALYTWAAIAERPLRLPARTHRARFLLLGVFLAAFQLCFAAGIALTDASTAALFQCVEPTTAALLGALLRLERLTTAKALSALLAGGGILLMELDPSRAHASTNTTNGSEANGMQRVIGCTLLFGQGIGIACFCLLQRQLLRLTAPPTSSSGEQRLLDGASPSSSVGDDGCESAAASNGNSGGGAPITTTTTTTPPPSPSPPCYGPITVTAHAYLSSLAVMVLAAAVSTIGRLESPPPLSAAGMGRIFTSELSLVGVAYAVLLGSCAGYALRAWANRTVEASVLVLYNAVQPPLTALLELLLDHSRGYTLREAGGTALVMLAVVIAGSPRVGRLLACGARTAARDS